MIVNTIAQTDSDAWCSKLWKVHRNDKQTFFKIIIQKNPTKYKNVYKLLVTIKTYPSNFRDVFIFIWKMQK